MLTNHLPGFLLSTEVVCCGSPTPVDSQNWLQHTKRDCARRRRLGRATNGQMRRNSKAANGKRYGRSKLTDRLTCDIRLSSPSRCGNVCLLLVRIQFPLGFPGIQATETDYGVLTSE